jgi:hypothetical protein
MNALSPLTGSAPTGVCVISDDGSMRCARPAPTAEEGASLSAAAVENLGGAVLQIAVGYDWGCAVLDTGNVRCWLMDYLGYGLGTGLGETLLATEDLELGGPVSMVRVSGDTDTCVLMKTGQIRCWPSDIAQDLSDPANQALIRDLHLF